MPASSSAFFLGKRRLQGKGVASTREEVVSVFCVLWGNMLQPWGHYSILDTEVAFGMGGWWGGIECVYSSVC